MSSPAATEPPGEHITGVRETDLTTKSGQERYLVHELGLTYPQAKALICAFRRDQERPLASAAKKYDTSFLAWLMRQAPGGRLTKHKQWQLGQAGWRTHT